LIQTEIHKLTGETDRVGRLAASIPMQRGGTAEEVAEVVLWLLSDAASYVTGMTVDIAGGRGL
jgi:NAD(P)-dependent dehydrogenase (short-subunit alcohol dehydrogenase family)